MVLTSNYEDGEYIGGNNLKNYHRSSVTSGQIMLRQCEGFIIILFPTFRISCVFSVIHDECGLPYVIICCILLGDCNNVFNIHFYVLSRVLSTKFSCKTPIEDSSI
jgi:hypothetical protein